jgi:hypothetical protein
VAVKNRSNVIHREQQSSRSYGFHRPGKRTVQWADGWIQELRETRRTAKIAVVRRAQGWSKGIYCASPDELKPAEKLELINRGCSGFDIDHNFLLTYQSEVIC